MNMIFDMQRWLYGSAIESLKALGEAGSAGVPALIAAAFGFGLLHALLPGHGKAVLTSYYAGKGGLGGALLSSAILILTHVGSAVVLVLCGFAILQRTIGGAGRAPALEHASQVLILMVGLWLLWRALRPHGGEHHGRSGFALALVAGLVPCPLTTFIMTYALAHGLITAGLVLSGMFAAGMIVTVAALPLLAVLFREKLLPFLTRTEWWRRALSHVLETSTASALVLFGALPLLVS